jgi:hypothetical protein
VEIDQKDKSAYAALDWDYFALHRLGAAVYFARGVE